MATLCVTGMQSALQNISAPDLFHHFDEALAIRLAKHYLQTPDKDNLKYMAICIREFRFDTVEKLISPLMPFLLQYLICDGTPAAMDALRAIAGVLRQKQSVGDMLSKFFEYLMPVMIVRVSDEAALEGGLQTIERLTGRPRTRLLMNDNSRIHNELLLYLVDNPTEVCTMHIID